MAIMLGTGTGQNLEYHSLTQSKDIVQTKVISLAAVAILEYHR